MKIEGYEINKVPKKNKHLSQGKNTLLIMAIPCFLLMIAFNYVPIFGWIYAFFDYKPGLKLSQCEFVGLKYFKLIFEEPELLPVLRNTMAISILGLISTIFPMIFAIMLSELSSKRYKKIIQTTTTLPNFISWVVVYSIFFAMFNTNEGFVNEILMKLKIINKPTNLLANSDIVWYFQTGVSIWKSLGFSAIVYLAAISGIDLELYSAVKVDGATRINTIRYVTIPGLIPTYLALLLLGIGNILSNGFEQYFVFYNPLVHNKIQVLDYYLYRIGLVLNDYSFSTALGMLKTLISIILMTIANLVSKRLRGQSII